MIGLVFLALFYGMILGFLVGKYHERWDWNDLIRKGIIPKPKSVIIPDHLIEK